MSENKWITETRAIELRATETDNNRFEGLACKYDVVDSYGTKFVKNCFTRGGLDDRVYSLLWNHDPTRPVGTFTAEEREDGLYIVGRWDENTAGKEARVAALSGSAADLSVGFAWLKDATAPEDTITIARLQEVSQVTSRFGAVPGSVLTAVRTALEAQDEDRWGTEYPNKEIMVSQSTETEEKTTEDEAEVEAVEVEDTTEEANEQRSEEKCCEAEDSKECCQTDIVAENLEEQKRNLSILALAAYIKRALS